MNVVPRVQTSSFGRARAEPRRARPARQQQCRKEKAKDEALNAPLRSPPRHALLTTPRSTRAFPHCRNISSATGRRAPSRSRRRSARTRRASSAGAARASKSSAGSSTIRIQILHLYCARRPPILAWALLETLKRHPSLPDVDIPVNCRDKPGSSRRGKGFKPPPLAFSYTTGREFSDVPLPDYTFWGLPYADLPPWPEWLHFAASPENAWERKLDKMVWVGSPTNPLRQAFQRCAPQFFGERLIHRMPQKDPMHELAWRCKPTVDGKPCGVKPPDWTPLQEQCKYKYILHLPGISDWLEHFKHQLACGSVNIFLGPRPPKQWAMRRQRLSSSLRRQRLTF